MEEGVQVRFHKCCQEIIDYPGKVTHFLEYAKDYARKGLTQHTAELIHGQILYILSNLNFVRGERMKEIKNELRRIHRDTA